MRHRCPSTPCTRRARRIGAPIRERFVFVRDGFSFWAFLLAPLWMLRHRLWLVLFGYVICRRAVASRLRAGSARRQRRAIVGTALLSLLVGFEAATLRRWTLARRGWTNARHRRRRRSRSRPSGASSTRWVEASRCRHRRPTPQSRVSPACAPRARDVVRRHRPLPAARSARGDASPSSITAPAICTRRRKPSSAPRARAGIDAADPGDAAIPTRSRAPTAWCCPASARSPTAGAGLTRSPAWSRR